MKELIESDGIPGDLHANETLLISEEKSVLNVSRDPARVSLPLTITKTVSAAQSRHPPAQDLVSADHVAFPPSDSRCSLEGKHRWRMRPC